MCILYVPVCICLHLVFGAHLRAWAHLSGNAWKHTGRVELRECVQNACVPVHLRCIGVVGARIWRTRGCTYPCFAHPPLWFHFRPPSVLACERRRRGRSPARARTFLRLLLFVPVSVLAPAHVPSLCAGVCNPTLAREHSTLPWGGGCFGYGGRALENRENRAALGCGLPARGC